MDSMYISHNELLAVDNQNHPQQDSDIVHIV
jgi:hypothetical protein